MADKVCSGDCLKCSVQQQVYCAAQHGHAIMAAIPAIVDRLDRLEASLSRFGQTTEEFINPLRVKHDAQKGAGAENRASETINNIE